MYELDGEGRPRFISLACPRDGEVVVGGDVILSEGQEGFARRAAEQRQYNREKARTRNRRISISRGDTQSHLIGLRGEVAFRQLSGLEWNEDPFANVIERGFDFMARENLRIECRTRGRGFSLCVRQGWVVRCDFFVVMKDWKHSTAPGEPPIEGERRVSPVGWITAEAFEEIKRPVIFPDAKRPVDVVDQKHLADFRTLFNLLGIEWPALERESPRRLPHQVPPQGDLFR